MASVAFVAATLAVAVSVASKLRGACHRTQRRPSSYNCVMPENWKEHNVMKCCELQRLKLNTIGSLLIPQRYVELQGAFSVNGAIQISHCVRPYGLIKGEKNNDSIKKKKNKRRRLRKKCREREIEEERGRERKRERERGGGGVTERE